MIKRTALKRSMKPIKKKRSKPRRGVVKDPKYLDFIRQQKCAACTSWGSKQSSTTEAAHVGERGLGQKCSDRETIPLCVLHHRVGMIAAHKIGKKFWVYHSLDRIKLIELYNAQYELEAAF